MADRSADINAAERIVSTLRLFERAEEVIKQAHSDETEAANRSKRLEMLKSELTRVSGEVQKARAELQQLHKKKEEETQLLESNQSDRVQKATTIANKAIKEANDERERVVTATKKTIEQIERDKQARYNELRELDGKLEEKRKEHQEFVRRITR